MLCNISQNAMGQQGGYPYPIMLCNISQNAMGQQGGTLPGPAGGRGGTQGGTQYPPGGEGGGGYPGGYPIPPRGVPRGVPGGVPRGGTRGGTQLGQHREYLLHSGRYASCVHAGGLSCLQLVNHGGCSFLKKMLVLNYTSIIQDQNI